MRTAIKWAVVIFFVLGTIFFWFIPWKDLDLSKKVIDYMTFFITILGFSATIYQLRETEIAVRESQEKPRLELEILAPSSSNTKNDNYQSKPVNALRLHKPSRNSKKVSTTFAMRINNTGKIAASNIWMTFLIQRRGSENKEKIGKIDITYDPKNQHYRNQAEYYDYDVRPDYEGKAFRRTGLTFHYGESLVIHNDPYVHPVIAEVVIEMAVDDIETDFEIKYRIQSYEGNEAMDEISRNKKSKVNGLIYPISFYLDNANE